jgi:hypothetical protein
MLPSHTPSSSRRLASPGSATALAAAWLAEQQNAQAQQAAGSNRGHRQTLLLDLPRLARSHPAIAGRFAGRSGGYSFSAPVLKEREYRLDGLFLPPPDRPELPALILEAQMASDPLFYRRLYAETARLLQQQATIRHWQVLVI